MNKEKLINYIEENIEDLKVFIEDRAKEYASIQDKLNKIKDQHEKVANLLANEDITLGELNNQLDKEYDWNLSNIEI